MTILSLIFKRAWQAKFLHHTLVRKTKNVYFFKMNKWYYYHFLKFLMGTKLPKMSRSNTSRYSRGPRLVLRSRVLVLGSSRGRDDSFVKSLYSLNFEGLQAHHTQGPEMAPGWP